MKEQIQKLIAAGRLEEALELLAKMTDQAILLQARFADGKRQYNTGQLTFNEWAQVQAKVNYAALEMVNQAKSMPATEDFSTVPQTGTGHGVKRKVFISYNSEDSTVARQVKDFLESKGLEVLIDQDDLPPGKSIMEFIQESIKSSDAVLSIVSAKSLASGWVGQESVASMYAVWLADKKFIPVRLDDVVFDIDFQIAAQESIQEKLRALETKISKLRDLGGDSRAFDDDRNRLGELRNNLGQIIQRLKSVNIPNISADGFTPNMVKVIAAIQ
jgi:hypothetical protein